MDMQEERSLDRKFSSENGESFIERRSSVAVVTSFVSRGAERLGGDSYSTASRYPIGILVILIVAHIYFDSSIPLWMRLYREGQLRSDSEGCSSLQRKLENLHHSSSLAEVDDSFFSTEHTEPHCSWYLRKTSEGNWIRVPHTFTKGAALSVQASIGTSLFYAYNYCIGGMAQLKRCWELRGLLTFAPVGLMFGLTAVFGFLAQDALSPGSYALYAQSGVVIIPLMWSIVFRKALPMLTWTHIVLIAMGIVMYRISELDLNESLFSGVGLVWVGLKVLAGGVATIWAEAFLKSDSSVPFSVQASYIMPWKVLATFSTIYILPPYGLPSDRPGGFFHDWNSLTLCVIFNNLGDTIMSAVVAKVFDSVVKSVCGVVGIVFPTWAVSLLVGWEVVSLGSPSGQLKAFGGSIVVLGSFAYVFGREKAQKDEQSVGEMRTKESKQHEFIKPSGKLRTPRISDASTEIEFNAQEQA